MPKRTSDYDSWLLAELTDPGAAASYLNAAISESPDMLPAALGNVAKAHTMAKVAEEAGVTRESLYNTLSEVGNPRFHNLIAVLKALGLRIIILPQSQESSLQQPPSELAGINFAPRGPKIDLGSFERHPARGFELPIPPQGERLNMVNYEHN